MPNWTPEQKLAISKNNNNILVAAAAGSGKTTVLVERIIQKIIKDHVDIDKMLVATFTNAAASEMREKILVSIYKELEKKPEDEDMKRQILLLGKANISTIHAFCLDVIRNYFYELDISSSARIAPTEEIEMLRQEVIDDLFEGLYENEDPSFMKLVDQYASYKDDDEIVKLLNNTYRFIQSNPFPLEWLDEKIDYFKKSDKDDYSQSVFGKIILKDLDENVYNAVCRLRQILEEVSRIPELEKTKSSLEADIDTLEKLHKAIEQGWNKAYSYKGEKDFSFPVWKGDKVPIVAEFKARRDNILGDKRNEGIKGVINKILKCSSEEAFQGDYAMYDTLVCLKDLIIRFDKEFKKRKKEKNILEFDDIEHYALQLLVKKDENGKYVPTDVAKSYQEKFEEIAIDEYQDINQVQEYILSTISRGNNTFMVGDVKQSIYGFRQACPDLFLHKYHTFDLIDSENNESDNSSGVTIRLFNNFRSRENIIDFVNIIFENIMGPKLGKLNYTKDEYLNFSASYYPQDDNSYSNQELAKTEILLVEEKDPEEEDTAEEVEEDSVDEALEQINKNELEAELVSKKIKEIIESKINIYDSKTQKLRPVQYKDIVILLKAINSQYDPIGLNFQKVLSQNGIPVYCDSNDEFLKTYEIQTVINVLRIIDNPLDDIALVSVMRSQIGGFTDNELLEIRVCNKNSNFYDSLIKAKEELDGSLKEKVSNFILLIQKWQKEALFSDLAELVWDIFTVTGFYNYVSLMPNGEIRKNNLKKLFEITKAYEASNFKGLYGFIKYIERVSLGSNDLSPAKLVGENDNVVRITTIHKSKGLEYPIVFLSTTERKFVFIGLSNDLQLNQENGMGLNYIDTKLKIKYSTSSRDALIITNKEDILAESLRVLYVALTRAREKLYITGCQKDIEKYILDKTKEIEAFHKEDGKISSILLKKQKNFLDWIMLVYASKELDKVATLKTIEKKELLNKDDSQEEASISFDFSKNIDFDAIKKELNFDYKDYDKTLLPIKSTVSKIKQKEYEEQIKDLDDVLVDNNKKERQIIDITNNLPQFMSQNSSLTGAKKGTIIHYILQRLNLKKDYTNEDLQRFMQDLVDENAITKEQLSQIDIKQIKSFLDDDVAIEIKNCKALYKEKSFVTDYQVGDNSILVQGVIDLFYQTKDGEWVLLDYKTDYLPEGNINVLVDRYKKQLEIYKKALEDIIGKKVAHTYIYSLNLGKKVEL